MARTVLNAQLLAEMASEAGADAEQESGACPLVAVSESVPGATAQTESTWTAPTASLSAWHPANREHPVCEVLVTPMDRRKVVAAGIGASVVAAVGAWLAVAA